MVESKWRSSARLVVAAVAAGLVPLAQCHASHSGLPNEALVGSESEPSVFTNNSVISSRFEQLYAAGLHAPPLQVAEAALPHEINVTLSANTLAWRDLSGTLQRLLLWDAGFVATSRLELVRVFVECGLSMDDAVVPRDQFQAQGCASRLCNNNTRTAAGEPACTALRVKCAVNGLEGEASVQVALWSDEEPNDDIPRPTIFRVANQSYAIHMHESGATALGEGCPTQLRLAIPCTHVHSDVAEWCVPKPSGVVSSLLNTLRPSTAVRADAPRNSPNVVMPILWLSVMCLAGVVSIVFLLSQRKVKATTRGMDEPVNAKQVGAPATTVTSESELDFISIRSNAGTIGEPMDKTTRSLGGLSSINGSASYNDLMNASEALLAFQNDPLIIQKRIAMVDIEFTRRLCHGASGDVFVGRVHGQRVAVKQLLQLKRNEIDDLECFAREIQLTATLDHPNIIKMVGVAWNSLQNMALVLEYRSGGDLLNAIRKRGSRWSWNGEKLQVAIGVAKAMVYLHSRAHPLVHRDIKSRNILIDASTIEPALCDFGSSRNVSALDLLSTDPAGTILWSAPEVICSQNYTVKADIFSYGVVLAELDTCALPYTEERDSEGRSIQAIRIAHMVVENRVKPQLSEHCPRFIRELVVKCVKHKPESRPTAEEVLARLTEAADDCAALWKSKPFGPHSM